VLILDEPANGLDPAGIRWMRGLLRTYADQGGTVLLSSHLLHEIEVIADDLVLIGNGRTVAQGTKADLLHAAGTVTRSASGPALAQALELAGISSQLSQTGRSAPRPKPPGWARSRSPPASRSPSSGPADGAGLEEMFLELTAETRREGVAA
jgi:ABC-2 type transport system ATP-binding protein